MNTNAIDTMGTKGINVFDTVSYKHNAGVYTCVVTKIRTGGVVIRSVDNKDKMFLVYGNGLNNITKL